MDYAVGICDDLAADRDHLAALVRQWAARAGHTVKIRSPGFCWGTKCCWGIS